MPCTKRCNKLLSIQGFRDEIVRLVKISSVLLTLCQICQQFITREKRRWMPCMQSCYVPSITCEQWDLFYASLKSLIKACLLFLLPLILHDMAKARKAQIIDFPIWSDLLIGSDEVLNPPALERNKIPSSLSRSTIHSLHIKWTQGTSKGLCQSEKFNAWERY